MSKTYVVTIERNGTERVIRCAVIEGYSTFADLPKMIEIKHGAGWEITSATVERGEESKPCGFCHEPNCDGVHFGRKVR